MDLRHQDPFFISFEEPMAAYELSIGTFPFEKDPHPLCLLAAKQLQKYLKNQKEWTHNFGLEEGRNGVVIGKMFGVLIVKTTLNEIGYLAAFSGKLAGGNEHTKFVPPIFDMLTKNSFVNNGMEALTRINMEIKNLEETATPEKEDEINNLKTLRKNNSISLQNLIFDSFYFLNRSGKEKSLRNIFLSYNMNPPSGAGECAAPKLFNYAFKQKMQPLAIAEFWWGQSPKSATWKHGHFYPSCKEKCAPILGYMLGDGVLPLS